MGEGQQPNNCTIACLQRRVAEAVASIEKFEQMAAVSCEDLDFSNFGDMYNALNSALGDISDDLFKIDTTQTKYSEDWDKIEDAKFALDSIYNDKIFEFNKYYYAGVKKVQQLQAELKQSQALQLATFSIVLSILAFILTNAKILAANGIDFRNVLLVNLSYLLAVSFLFSLVYLFIENRNSEFSKSKRKLIKTMFIGIPVLLIIAIILISLFG